MFKNISFYLTSSVPFITQTVRKNSAAFFFFHFLSQGSIDFDLFLHLMIKSVNTFYLNLSFFQPLSVYLSLSVSIFLGPYVDIIAMDLLLEKSKENKHAHPH